MIPDERLIVAAFGRERATAAWSEWSRDRDLGSLDPGELRLLPSVYHNLRAAGVADDAIAPVVKQMTRSMFVRTRLILHDAATTVALLAAHGIESMLLKGAALVAGGYVDASARPMSDFDLLVRPGDAVAVAALLVEHGWESDQRPDRKALFARHAAVFKKGERSADVHWWALWESPDAAGDERIWRDAESAIIDGVTVRIPRPEHQLLHVIVHGTRAFDTAVRWIGDSLSIIRTREVDWDLFAREADARGVAYPAGEALAYLAELFEANVPAPAIETLRARRVTRRQRRLYAPRPASRSIEYLEALAYVSLAQPKATPLTARLLWLPRNLQYAWGIDKWWRLPGAALARAWGRIWKFNLRRRR